MDERQDKVKNLMDACQLYAVGYMLELTHGSDLDIEQVGKYVEECAEAIVKRCGGDAKDAED